jgi:hypothetical protein
MIETEWQNIAERYKGRIAAAVNSYKRNTGSYVELKSGHVTLTESRVLNSSDLPREADFRDTLAGTGQLGLFDGSGDDERKHEASLYAILLHGVSRHAEKRRECAFACVRFPNKDCSGYLGGRVDLFAMFPEVVQEFYGEKEQEVGIQIVRRKSAKAAGE